MPTTLIDIPSSPPAPEPRRKRWTRAECAVLEASGVFDGQRVELIQGELIDRMGKRRPHVNATYTVCLQLAKIFGSALVNQEAPIDVAAEDNPTSEPEPDVIVLRRAYSDFIEANPGPGDLRLVVEIADSSLNFDLTTKAVLYARAGIVEYWVLDVSRRRLIVHRNPIAGKYTDVTAWSEWETVSPLAAPEAGFRVGSAFEPTV